MAFSKKRRLKLEHLQARKLMAADIDLDNGILEIEGTNDNETIEISYEYNHHGEIDEVLVEIKDEDGDVIKDKDYDVEDVNWIVVNANGGDDVVTNNTDINMEAHGGEGNDTLNGGSVADYLFGGNGNDVINGNDGNDFVQGAVATV